MVTAANGSVCTLSTTTDARGAIIRVARFAEPTQTVVLGESGETVAPARAEDGSSLDGEAVRNGVTAVTAAHGSTHRHLQLRELCDFAHLDPWPEANSLAPADEGECCSGACGEGSDGIEEWTGFGPRAVCDLRGRADTGNQGRRPPLRGKQRRQRPALGGELRPGPLLAQGGVGRLLAPAADAGSPGTS